MSKKVVLFFPSYASDEAAPPLALTAIAGPLVTDGFEVVIVDATIEPDFVATVVEELQDAVCLGVSFITGPMIADVVKVCQAAKARFPELPIVAGGWHPSILPQQTAAAPFIDVVVVRQGEVTFREVVHRVADGESLEGVAGIVHKIEGEIITEAPRPYTPISDLPDRLPGTTLVDLDRYEQATGLRWMMYTTSHGCPFNCAYCSNATVYGRKLDLLEAERAVDEIAEIVARHNVQLLGIIDDIFFTFRERSLAIAEGLIRRNVKVSWYIQDRADSVARLTPEQIRLYRRAGLVRIHFGAESGSDDVLRSIEKHSNIGKTLAAVERCKQGDIRASFGFIFGLPDETDAEVLETVDLIRRIYGTYERADCHTNIFTPYPGSPLWEQSVALGVTAPTSLEGWVDYFPRVQVLPWLQGERHAWLQRIRQSLRWGFPNMRVGEDRGSRRHRLALTMLGPSARWRLRNHRYGLPLEVYAWQAAKHWTTPGVRRGQPGARTIS